MSLIEHVRELRTRLLRASLAIVAGFGVGFALSGRVLEMLEAPYCALPQSLNERGECSFVQLGVADYLLLELKIALWVGLIVAAPIWLYQLWAFIAPGLHRHERKYAYLFTAIAAPLFALGAFLAMFVVQKGLEFLLDVVGENVDTTLEITRYISFVTDLIMLFGVAFEFPLVFLMLNFAGVVTAKRMLSWWRVVVFIFFAFAAVVTPTPDPFGMTALAGALTVLYLIAVGVAFLNDKRKGRGRELYEGLDDDAISPLGQDSCDGVGGSERVEVPTPVAAPVPVTKPLPLDRSYDDLT